MKITLLGTLPPIKGISEYCIEQAKSLSKKIDIDFINFKAIYPEFLYSGGSTKEKDKAFKIDLNKNLKVRNILTWYNPFSWIFAGLTAKGSILHFHWWSFTLFPVFFTVVYICKLRKKKIVCTVHNVTAHESNILDSLFSKWIFSLSDRLIVHSEANKEKLIRLFGIKNSCIFIIPYGVLNFYKDKKISKSTARKKLKIDSKDKIVLYFGNIRKYKGIDILIKAFSKVKKKVPEAKLIIAGKNWISWRPFEKIIKKNNLQNDIIVKLEYILTSEIKYYFLAADLVVLPYLKFDSQSGVGNIALVFNKVLIVTNVGGLKDLVKDKRSIVKPNNERLLSKAIIDVLLSDSFKKKLEKDSKNICKDYSWDKISKRTIDLYKAIKW